MIEGIIDLVAPLKFSSVEKKANSDSKRPPPSDVIFYSDATTDTKNTYNRNHQQVFYYLWLFMGYVSFELQHKFDKVLSELFDVEGHQVGAQVVPNI